MSLTTETISYLLKYIKQLSQEYFDESLRDTERGVFMFGYRNINELIHTTRHVPIFAHGTSLIADNPDGIFNELIGMINSYNPKTQFVIDIAILDTNYSVSYIINKDDYQTVNADTTVYSDRENIKIAENIIKCDECKKISLTLKQCINCKTVWYCDKECQKKAWPNHKEVCKSISEKM